MLKNLKIKNFILIERLDIDFESGFQVLTGETGAGKSIIVGAIGLLCGQRGQTDLVRSGADKTILEAEFDYLGDGQIQSILNELSIDLMDEIVLIRREINKKGISRAFVNDTPVSLNQLSRIASYLIDLHGQHQHQKLLHKESHTYYLDAYANAFQTLQHYKEVYTQFQAQKTELNQLFDKRKNSINEHDLFSFQATELDQANLDANEMDSLKSEKLKLENSELLYDVSQTVSDNLYSADNSVLNMVSTALSRLVEVQQFDKEFAELAENLKSAQVTIEEVGRSAELIKERIEFNPDRLEEIRKREAELEWLLKKYQKKTISDLIEHHHNLKQELNRIQNFDDEIHDLERNIKEHQQRLSKIAGQLSELRQKSALNLEEKMTDTLQSLGIKNGKFSVKVEKVEDNMGDVLIEGIHYKSTETGIDDIEFLISLNIGEPVKPLQKVASGGEISRIMLAIKSILADIDETEVLIFDEIDSGISGKIAQIVGKKMQDISENRQLIVITHLPQIACQAKNHFSVVKSELNGRAVIQVVKLNPTERIEDIAKLLGGEKITPQSLANAENLLHSAKQN